jgi:hypothetical protein
MKTGDVISMRLPFAFLKVGERNRDVSPTEDSFQVADKPSEILGYEWNVVCGL